MSTTTLDRGGAAADLTEQSLGALAVGIPGATAVLRRNRLDFCCGGEATLREAAARRGLDAAAVAAELAALAPAAAEEEALPEDPDALISLIEARFHAAHRRELPELIRLARRVEAVHAGHPESPRGLADLLARMEAELESPMQKEEQVLFPMMRRGGHPMIGQPIAMMRHEHDDHGEHLRELEALTRDFTPPEEACRSWRALYAGLDHLTAELMRHIAIENGVLFPRFGA
jgi:regulator of cell morphogenesis and NO signaling